MRIAVTGATGKLGRLVVQGLLSGSSGELSALIGRPTTPLKEGLEAAIRP